MKTGRNEPCPCGSGKKHKNCCEKNRGRGEWITTMVWILLLALMGGGILAVLWDDPAEDPPPGKVWSEEHGHYHDVP